MAYDRNKPIALAQEELNYHEKASNSQLYDKTANSGSGNWTKYGAELDALGDFYNGAKNGYAWCDQFYDWLMYKSFGKEAALKLLCQTKYSAGAGCYYSAMYYKQKGQFYGPNTVPQPGDQIFFTYSAGEVSHTGIVEKVVGSTIYTIEGNTSDGVYRRTYTVGQSSVYGYGRPDWGIAETAAPATAQTPTTDTDDQITALAKEVIAGKWGIGADRVTRLLNAGHDYAAVQNRVNEILSGKTSAPSQPSAPATEEKPQQAQKIKLGSEYEIKLNELSEGMVDTDSDHRIARAQTLLIARGLSCGGKVRNGVETPDGEFGPTTKSAVEQFQKANSIKADGVIGADTMTALLK